MILASSVYGEDAAYLYAQNNRYYIRTGKYLYRMMLSGSRQEMEQALNRGKFASTDLNYENLVTQYNGPLKAPVTTLLKTVGLHSD